ncbi:MAG: calcium-binding protein, partial [Planctomycetales bacterium]|nr:calcium-binding protein [Planctomycetales bacterium]
VEIDPVAKSLVVTELMFVQGSDFPLRISEANGSYAGYGMGILGEEFVVEKVGVLRGQSLHGETIADRVSLDASTTVVRTVLEAGTDAATATARVGAIDVESSGGNVAMRVDAAFTLQSGSQAVLLADLVSDPSPTMDAPQWTGSASASLPIAISGSINGLSVHPDARIQFNWDDIIGAGNQSRISTDHLDDLMQFEHMSLLGLTESTPLAELGFGSGVPTGDAADLMLTMQDGSTHTVSLAGATTVGDVLERVRAAGNGMITAAISADARGIILRDFSEGISRFSVSGGAADALGISQSDLDNDAVLVGNPVYQDSLISVLRDAFPLIQRLENAESMQTELPIVGVSLAELQQPSERMTSAINQLAADENVTLQVLAGVLATSFGIDVIDVSVGINGGLLEVSIEDAAAQTSIHPIRLDLNDAELGVLADRMSESPVDLQTTLTTRLALGLSYQNPFRPSGFLVPDSTSISATAFVGATLLTFDTNVGALAITATNGVVALDEDGEGPLVSPAVFAADVLPGTAVVTEGRVSVDELALLSVMADATGMADAAFTTVNAGSGGVIGLYDLSVSDLSDAAATSTIVVPDFRGQLAGFGLSSDLSALKTSWGALVADLRTQLATRVFDFDLPLVGTNLDDALLFLDELEPIFEDATGLDTGDAVAAARLALFDQLSSLGFLQDRNGDSLVDLDDVDFNVDPQLAFVEFAVDLGSGLRTVSTPTFSSAMPGLGFELDDAPIILQSRFDTKLVVGVSRLEGAYLRFEDGDAGDLVIEISAQLPNTSVYRGQLPLLEVDATADTASFAGTFIIDVGGTPGTVTAGQLSSGDLEIASMVNAMIDMDLGLSATKGGAAGQTEWLRANLQVDWEISTQAGEPSPAASGLSLTGVPLPTVTISGVKIDFAQYLKQFVEPIIEMIDDSLETVDIWDEFIADYRVGDAGYRRLSLLEGDTSWQGLLGSLASYSLDYSNYKEVRDWVDSVRGFFAALLAAADAKWLDFGSVTLPIGVAFQAGLVGKGLPLSPSGITASDIHQQILSQATPDEVNAYQSTLNMSCSQPLVSCPEDSGGNPLGINFDGSFGDDDGDFGLSHPLLSDPSAVFALLTGTSMDLITFDLPPLDVKYSGRIPFGTVGFATVSAAIDFSVNVDMDFGYDTYGLEQYIAKGRDDEQRLLDGLYILDKPGREASAQIGIGITAEVGTASIAPLLQIADATPFVSNVHIAAGVGGGFRGEYFADLRANDGMDRLRGRSLLEYSQQGVDALFDHGLDVSAELYAFAEFFLSVGVGGSSFYSKLAEATLRIIDQHYTLASLVIKEKPKDRTLTPPPLGMVETEESPTDLSLADPPSGPALRLGTTEQSDRLLIVPFGAGVAIESNGRREEFPNTGDQTFVKIVADGLGGDDVIIVDPAVTIPIEFSGGDGNDRLVAGGGPAQLYGGSGQDTLILGPAGGSAFGGDDDDFLSGGSGNDSLDGGAGADQLFGREGNDTLRGGSGADELYGEEGDDTLDGGADDDRLLGGIGNDELDGGSENDILFGQQGDDTLVGGIGNDRLLGEFGNDVLIGDIGTYNGSVFTALAGAGADQIDGGRGDDVIHGVGGNDVISAGVGFDTVFGGTGDDTIHGDSGNDFIDGQEGDDAIFGGSGSDTLVGGWGSDVVLAGDSLNDQGVLGETHRMYGDLQNPEATAPSAAPDHADILRGGIDDDELFGGAGPDTLVGFAGNDLLVGGLHADLIYAGNDRNGGGTANETNTIF